MFPNNNYRLVEKKTEIPVKEQILIYKGEAIDPKKLMKDTG